MEREFSALALKRGKFANLFVLSRPWNGLIVGLMAVLGYTITALTIEPIIATWLFLSFLFIYMAGTIVNDIADYKVDKINMPYRPLQTGNVSIREAAALAIFLYLLSFIIASQNYLFLLGVGLFFIITIIYSWPPFRFVGRGIFGSLLLAIVTVLIPSISGAMVALTSYKLPLYITLAFISFTLLFVAVTILKDFKDIEGDRRLGKKTFVITVGKKNAIISSLILTLIFFPLTTYFLWGLVNYVILFLLISVLFFAALLSIELIQRKSEDQIIEEKRFMRARILMFAYVLLILAFTVLR